MPPTCCSLFGFDASITLSSGTLAYVFVCNLGSINNVCAVMLAVQSSVVLVTVPVKNTSELMALFVQTFPGQILSVQAASRCSQSYVSLTVVEQCWVLSWLGPLPQVHAASCVIFLRTSNMNSAWVSLWSLAACSTVTVSGQNSSTIHCYLVPSSAWDGMKRLILDLLR